MKFDYGLPEVLVCLGRGREGEHHHYNNARQPLFHYATSSVAVS